MQPKCSWCGTGLTADDNLLCPECTTKQVEKRAAMVADKAAKDAEELRTRWNPLARLPVIKTPEVKEGVRDITCNGCWEMVHVGSNAEYADCPKCGHSIRLKVPAKKNAESIQKEIDSRNVPLLPREYQMHNRTKKDRCANGGN